MIDQIAWVVGVVAEAATVDIVGAYGQSDFEGEIAEQAVMADPGH